MSLRTKALAALAAASLTLLVLVAWRDYLLQYALLVAIAVGALVFTTLGTSERLSRSYRRRGPRSIRRRDDGA